MYTPLYIHNVPDYICLLITTVHHCPLLLQAATGEISLFCLFCGAMHRLSNSILTDEVEWKGNIIFAEIYTVIHSELLWILAVCKAFPAF